MSYGVHHARSADALAWLLKHQSPVPAEEVSAVLAFRAALVAAHQERSETATHGANVYMAVFRDQRDVRGLTRVANSGSVALTQLLGEHPRFASHAMSFTDALQLDTLSPSGQAWAEAAKHAVLATETAVAVPSWRQQPGQAWAVVAGIADCAEALTALDRHLTKSATAVIPKWEQVLRRPSAELRLVARHVGYVARAGALDPTADLLRRRSGTLEPVRRPEDLPRAMRGMASELQGGELSVRDLRAFALMQSNIADICAGMARGPAAEAEALRDSFSARERGFRGLAAATARTASYGPSSGRRLLAQAEDVGHATFRLSRDSGPVSMTLLARLDVEQAQVGARLARSVDRASAKGHYLVVDDVALELKWRRVEPGEQPDVVRAAGALAVPATASHVAAVEAVRQDLRRSAESLSVAVPARRRLRTLLDDQPYGSRPLTPNRRPSCKL